ncbi:hypothetical protein DFP73DRAFT_598026 [Morchella snyderi]|nr:hypothetical protein DFP73DRAFT_598026 [Morchella snyderi]
MASGERAFRQGERITIGAREKPSICLGALGTLMRPRSILLLLWRCSLSTERPGRPERPPRLAEPPGLLMDALNAPSNYRVLWEQNVQQDEQHMKGEEYAGPGGNIGVGPSGSDNGGGREEVVHAQFRGIEAEEEGDEDEEEQEELDHERGKEEEDV